MVGHGKNIRFCEDLWFGSSPLAMQYWDLYCICRDQCQTIQQIWDDQTLKLSFRRNFDDNTMNAWPELTEIAKGISFTDSTDSLLWQYENSGQYSSISLYAIINFRGVVPFYISAVWKLLIPPRIHVFLWLLFHNKLMTRDNLKKRKFRKPKDRVFCFVMSSFNICFLIAQ